MEKAIGNHSIKMLPKSLQVLLQSTLRDTSFTKSLPYVLSLDLFCTSKTQSAPPHPRQDFFFSYLLPCLVLFQQLSCLKFLLLKLLHSKLKLIAGMCQRTPCHLVDTVLHLSFQGKVMIFWSPEERRAIMFSPFCI